MIRHLAYPRCGSSLQRYYITYLTGLRPTQCSELGYIRNDMNDLVKEFYQGDDMFVKYHTVEEIKSFGSDINEQTDILILGLRHPVENLSTFFYSDELNKKNQLPRFMDPNDHVIGIENNKVKYDLKYHEILSRHNNLKKEKKELINFYLSDPDGRDFFKEFFYDEYINNIRYYEKWGGKKHIINYDNLKENPTEEITKLNSFLGVNESKLHELLKDLELHNQKMYELKSSHYLKVNTNGSDTHFWRNLLYPEDIKRIAGQAKRDGLDKYFDL